jgi:hypothetical protein
MLGTSLGLSTQPLLRLRCGCYGRHLIALMMRLLLLEFRFAVTVIGLLMESGHSSHSVLAPLRACLKGLKGCVCFQWFLAHCGLFGNEKVDEEARKAADLGLDDGAQRGRISFEVVKGLIRSQVKDGLSSTSRVYGDCPFRCL